MVDTAYCNDGIGDPSNILIQSLDIDSTCTSGGFKFSKMTVPTDGTDVTWSATNSLQGNMHKLSNRFSVNTSFEGAYRISPLDILKIM